MRKLLKAGVEVFSKHGFEAATTKQIAKKAGLNDSLIIRYFRSKDGLLQAIIFNSVEESYARLEARPPEDDLEKEITTLLMEAAEDYVENRDFHRISTSRALTDPRVTKLVSQHMEIGPEHRLLLRLKRFQDLGQISPQCDLIEFTHVLLLQVLGVLLTVIIQKKTEPRLLEAVVRRSAKLITAGLKV